MKLVTPEQMREMDRRTIEEIGLPSALLMERAALGAVDLLCKFLPEPTHLAAQNAHARHTHRIIIFCGGGNNAGDGFAMARLLQARGFYPQIVLLSAHKKLRGDAQMNFDILKKLDIEIFDLSNLSTDEIRPQLTSIYLDADSLCTPLAICDALLGTGIDRPVTDRFLAAIEFINELHHPQSAPQGRENISSSQKPLIFSVDLPSALNATTGEAMGTAVRADLTATFGFAKLGQSLYPGRALCGELRVIDIGIPTSVAEAVGFTAEWLDHAWAHNHARQYLARRPYDFHKGDSGRVLLLAGSHEKAGAAFLAAGGALRAGAGLLTVGTHAQVVDRVALAVPEAMGETMLAHTHDGRVEERLRTTAERMDVVAIGPGIGTSDGTMQQLMVLLESDVRHLVIDADALTVLAKLENYDKLRAFNAEQPDDFRTILTPHPGEMSRLCMIRTVEIQAEPLKYARELAAKTGAIVVLKTATTIIAAPDGRTAINQSGNPGMATGGTGDVLTGIIAGRLAEKSRFFDDNQNSGAHPAAPAQSPQSPTPADQTFERVCLAVFAHGRAGDLARDAVGERALVAGDLLEHLGPVFHELGR